MSALIDFILNNPKDVLVPVGISLLTAGLTLGGVYLSNQNQVKLAKDKMSDDYKRESDNFLRSKLETFYHIFYKWEVNASGVYLVFAQCFQGKINGGQALDLVSKNRIIADGDFQLIITMLNLYFPSLLDSYEKVNKARGTVMDYCDPNFIGVITQKQYQQFLMCQEIFENECEIFRSEIAKLSKISI